MQRSDCLFTRALYGRKASRTNQIKLLQLTLPLNIGYSPRASSLSPMGLLKHKLTSYRPAVFELLSGPASAAYQLHRRFIGLEYDLSRPIRSSQTG